VSLALCERGCVMFAEMVMAAMAAAAAVALTAFNFAPRAAADAADDMDELVPAPFTATMVPRRELVMP
jgi:hypothetical protein